MDFSKVFSFGIEMTVTLALAFGLYLLRVKLSPTETGEWLRSNGLSISISLVVAWLLAFGLVFSPNIAAILGALGFNAEQSAAAMALVIAGFTIGSTAEPTS